MMKFFVKCIYLCNIYNTFVPIFKSCNFIDHAIGGGHTDKSSIANHLVMLSFHYRYLLLKISTYMVLMNERQRGIRR